MWLLTVFIYIYYVIINSFYLKYLSEYDFCGIWIEDLKGKKFIYYYFNLFIITSYRDKTLFIIKIKVFILFFTLFNPLTLLHDSLNSV